MLNSRFGYNYLKLFISANILVMSLLLTSCVPESTRPAVKNSNSSTNDSNTPGSIYPEPVFPLTGTFIQQASTQTQGLLSLTKAFSDSFMIRGKDLSVYLRKLPNTTKFCIVANYNYVTFVDTDGQVKLKDKFLILAGKPKSFTDTIKKTTEYFLQVEPAGSATNQNDCNVYNLTNELLSSSASGSIHFSLSQLCTDCSSTVTSTGLKLYNVNGQEVPTLNISPLTLAITGTDGSSTGNSCVDSAACRARGFDCCLQSQCVNDLALKPGTIESDPNYLAAKEDVRVNPDRKVLYPQFYFVCDSRPDGDGPEDDGENTDPDYLAAVRQMKLKNLYQCLNKIDGDFSYCTVQFDNVSEFIPGNFSAGDPGKEFFDDINFSKSNTNLGTGVYANNITKVVYGGRTLFEAANGTNPGIPLNNVSFVPSTFNDTLGSAQGINVTDILPLNAPDDDLYITYKVDGTCEKVGSTLARCTKTFIQGTSLVPATAYLSTSHNNSVNFDLPDYATLTGTSSAVIVKVGGVVLADDPANYVKNTAAKRIDFVRAPYPNQKVEITYFVSGASVASLTKSKSAAQTEVNSMCSCGVNLNCNLKPVFDNNNAEIDYACVYPTPTSTEPPVNQTVSVSSKNVPHRYFDESGVNYDEDYATAPAQELKEFSYTSGNVLKPNNLGAIPVGFNEIYGSFLKNGPHARPSKMVRVKKDKYYDLLVSTGSFASCANCGSDYYNALQKVFPQSFANGGGGYAPDLHESRREGNSGSYRSDDLLYGRACFVPATMIPWTHVASTDPKFQRQARLSAQHFLYANGYNRDWYGFDYGSLVGSFDGVNWFSIGSNRRIKAKTGKLFLAVNAYYGDQSIDNNITVNVSETINFANTNIPEHDTLTDGAQCQKSHFCSTDNDCIKQLGYDYSCQNVAALSTNWPVFDVLGTEAVSDAGTMKRTISSLLGGTNGQAKRCVYRGRGAPCDTDLTKTDPATIFNGSTAPGTLACSPNNSCQPITTARFNDRIARFANTPANQNLIDAAAPAAKSDLVGLAARLLGRPFEYYGNKSSPTTVIPGTSFSVRSTLNANGVSAVCVPGKNISSATTTIDLNNRYPTSILDSSDKIFGVGSTMNKTTQSQKYFNACPATGTTGALLHQTNLNLLTSDELTTAAISQNLSTNSLDLTPLVNLGIFSNTGTTTVTPITTVGYQRNTCLRAAGASCFSDMECGPSANIASKARSADLSALLNIAEEKFWEEELTCGNPDFKTVNNSALNPNYDIKKNRCCREVGKDLTVYTQKNDGLGANDFRWCDATTKLPVVGGVNAAVTSKNKYSRVHTGYDKMTCDPDQVTGAKTFALSIHNVSKTDAMKQILQQYKTLDTVNQRTCCTSHWVRKFAASNGGGTTFSRSKLQTVDKEMFKHVSWFPQDTTIFTDTPFHCDANNYANSSCEVKSFTAAEEEKYLKWAGSLELIGIPQVAVMTNDQIFKVVDDNQADIAPLTLPLDNSIQDVGVALSDFEDTSGKYYSAASLLKFNIGPGQPNKLKQVFSENEFNCCVPSGQQVPDYTTASQCCTGNIGNIDNIKRCCLPDFTDLTVYLNRYVSSEGRGLPDSAYDPKTGYIKDAGQVKLMAAQKNLCCSGQVMTGVAISQLSIPLTGGLYAPPDQLSTSRRFNYRTDSVDNNAETGSVGSIFDAGVRWNNHVYCVPAGFAQ